VRIIIHMLAVPDRFLTDNSEDARETSSAAVRIRTAAAIPAGNPDAMSRTATMHPVFCGKFGRGGSTSAGRPVDALIDG
jgi:hypothetical protein